MNSESFNLQIKNEHCFFCKKKLTINDEEENEEEELQDIITLKCKHSFHLKCGKSWIIQPKTIIQQMKEKGLPMTKCPECLLSEKDFNIKKEKNLNSSRWMNGNELATIKDSTYKSQIVSSKEIVYNNYPSSPSQYLYHLDNKEQENKEDERINGLTLNSNNKIANTIYNDSEDEEEEKQFNDLDPSKKRQFVPVLKWATISRIVIDYGYLKDNGYDNMEKLYSSKVNIKEIYYCIGITRWCDLIDKLNFSKHYLENDELYPINFLVSKYGISYTDLQNDLNMNLNDFIDFGFSSNELKLLNLNLNNLITDFSIKKSDIIRFDFRINEWYTLGMNFENLLKLKFLTKDYKEAKWKQSLIKKFLKLNESQINILGLNNNANGNSKKIHKKKPKVN